jgi:hypothetical protein
MNIDDATGKSAQKFTFEHAHESSQGNQIHVRFGQCLDERALGGFVQLGAKISGRDEFRRQVSLAGPLEDAGGFNIAQNDRDLGAECSLRSGVGQRDKIGAPPGTQDSYAKMTLRHDGCSLQAQRPIPQARSNYDELRFGDLVLTKRIRMSIFPRSVEPY